MVLSGHDHRHVNCPTLVYIELVSCVSSAHGKWPTYSHGVKCWHISLVYVIWLDSTFGRSTFSLTTFNPAGIHHTLVHSLILYVHRLLPVNVYGRATNMLSV